MGTSLNREMALFAHVGMSPTGGLFVVALPLEAVAGRHILLHRSHHHGIVDVVHHTLQCKGGGRSAPSHRNSQYARERGGSSPHRNSHLQGRGWRIWHSLPAKVSSLFTGLPDSFTFSAAGQGHGLQLQ